MNCFELKNLRQYHNTIRLLELDATTIPQGEITAVLGPNGAGKTTLLRILAGLNTFEGQVKYMGHPLKSYTPKNLAQKIAWVPSQINLSFDINVLELVLLGRYPWNQGTPSYRDKEIAEKALETMGMISFRNRMISTLSSGEKQKAQIARSLSTQVECIILDEPCSHLDVKSRYQLFEVLQGIAKGGCSIILSSHDLLIASRFTQNTIALKQGKLFTQKRRSLSNEELSELFEVQLT